MTIFVLKRYFFAIFYIQVTIIQRVGFLPTRSINLTDRTHQKVPFCPSRCDPCPINLSDTSLLQCLTAFIKFMLGRICVRVCLLFFLNPGMDVEFLHGDGFMNYRAGWPFPPPPLLPLHPSPTAILLIIIRPPDLDLTKCHV